MLDSIYKRRCFFIAPTIEQKGKIMDVLKEYENQVNLLKDAQRKAFDVKDFGTVNCISMQIERYLQLIARP